MILQVSLYQGVSSDDNRWWFLVSEVEIADLERLSKKETRIEVSSLFPQIHCLSLTFIYSFPWIKTIMGQRITSSFNKSDKSSLF